MGTNDCVSGIRERMEDGRLRLWDEALNLGERHTKGLKNLSRVLSHHGRGSIKAMSFVRLDSRRGNVFEHIILRHGEELGLKGMKHDEVLQNLKLSDLKFVYVFYKNVLYVLNAPCWAENNKL